MMIQLRNVCFRYSKSKPLFEGLNLEIGRGTIIGLLGRNGEGKSTLMKLLTGQLVAQAGSICNQGIEAGKRRVELLQRVYMLHEDVTVPRVTVREYFDMLSPFYPSYDETIANELIRDLEISWEWNLAKISLGQRKKALIALALALRTPLLLLDEPTNGLDIPSKSIFRRLLAKYSHEGQTVIISTHQVRDLEQVIDRIVMLDANRIVCNESIERLSELFLFAPLTSENEASCIYREPSLIGELGVWKRRAEEEAGDFSMELFFNAMISERNRMHEVLHS